MTRSEELALHLFGQLKAGSWDKGELELIEEALHAAHREGLLEAAEAIEAALHPYSSRFQRVEHVPIWLRRKAAALTESCEASVKKENP